jgi:hypothetical protein
MPSGRKRQSPSPNSRSAHAGRSAKRTHQTSPRRGERPHSAQVRSSAGVSGSGVVASLEPAERHALAVRLGVVDEVVEHAVRELVQLRCSSRNAANVSLYGRRAIRRVYNAPLAGGIGPALSRVASGLSDARRALTRFGRARAGSGGASPRSPPPPFSAQRGRSGLPRGRRPPLPHRSRRWRKISRSAPSVLRLRGLVRLAVLERLLVVGRLDVFAVSKKGGSRPPF